MFPDSIIQRLHDQEVDGGAHSADAQLEAKHHVELLVPEPVDGVCVQRHVQALPAHPEQEPCHLHEPEPVLRSSETQQKLTETYEGCKDDCSESDSKH